MLSCDWSQRCTEPARHRVERSSRLHPVTLLRVCDRHLPEAEHDGYRRRGPADPQGEPMASHDDDGHELLRPKLHGSFTLSRLAGAGVVLVDRSGPTTHELVSLAIGDAATHVVMLGTLDEFDAIIGEVHRQVAELRAGQARSGNTPTAEKP